MDNLRKLSHWLSTTSYDALVLARRDSYKWIMEGNDNSVVTNVTTGVAYIVVFNSDSVRPIVICDNSDASRIDKEQNSLGLKVIEISWFEDIHTHIQHICSTYFSTPTYCSDIPLSYASCEIDSLINLRMQLSEVEIIRYRKLGQDCASIVESVIKQAKVGESELAIANCIKKECLYNGISPDCVLIGSDERILDYRHPIPTKKSFQKSLMIVLGGERDGLNISLTRMRYDTDIPKRIEDRMQCTQYVFAMSQLLMRSTPSYKEYFSELKKIYDFVGYSNEWKKHHQGGPTGYSCREFIISDHTLGFIKNNQAYAWNPTIKGTKCEETTLLSNNHIEMLTKSNSWPRKLIKTPLGNIDVASIYCNL